MFLTWWDKFKISSLLIFHKGVAWVMSFWLVAKIYWDTMMTDADHQAFYGYMPFGLGHYAPILIFAITYFIANGWPQPVLAKKIEEKKSEMLSDKLINN